MKKSFRFLTIYARRGTDSKVRPVNDKLPDYIHEETRENYNNLTREYQMARSLFEKGDLAEANRHINKALRESALVRGQTPAVVSIRRSLAKFKAEIESQNSQLECKF